MSAVLVLLTGLLQVAAPTVFDGGTASDRQALPEDREVAANLELLEQLELLQNLDLLRDLSEDSPLQDLPVGGDDKR